MESDVSAVIPILNKYGIEYKQETNSEVKICCPFHDERTPSFHIYNDNHCFCFGCNKFCWHDELVAKIANCSIIEAKKMLGTYDPNVNYGSGEKWTSDFKLPNLEFADPVKDYSEQFAKLPTEVPPEMNDFLKSKALNAFAYDLGKWRWHPKGTFKCWPNQEGICIPYFGPNGEVSTFRLRRFDHMRGKFTHPLAPKGVPLQASYMVFDHSQPVFFCEGETDSLSLRSTGRNVICLPGVGAKKQLHTAIMKCFEWDVPMVVFCGDNDEAGQNFNKYAIEATMTLGLGRYTPQIRTLRLPDEFNMLPSGGFKRKDINDFLVEGRLAEIMSAFDKNEQPRTLKNATGPAIIKEKEAPVLERMKEIFGDVKELPLSEIEGIFDD